MLPRRLLLVFLAWLLSAASAAACSIPVFRYALERWRAERADDLYTVVVFHRGPLSAEHKAAAETLQKLGDDQAPKANFTVELVDVSGKMTDAQRALWQTQKDSPLPWMVLRYPDSTDRTPTPWAGPLNEQTVRLLTESPARKEIAKRILRGESVVWLFLESGNKEQDDAAAKVLQAELTRLEKIVELPEGLGEGPVKLLSDLPVKVAFSVVRVSRKDAAEQALIGMLLHSEDDLHDLKEPMTFPVFGRGRFLDPHIGKGINGETLHERCQFLCSACSCRVKRLNPGTDLLMMVEWDVQLDTPQEKEPEKPSVEGRSVPIPPGNRANEIPHSGGEADLAVIEMPSGYRSPMSLLVGGAALGLLLIAGLGVALWMRMDREVDER